MPLVSRNTDDRRRAAELDKITQTHTKFGTVPDRKHLRDGQVAIVQTTGQLCWRDGDTIYTLTGTAI